MDQPLTLYYKSLAMKYATGIPQGSSMTWEDLYQEMVLASWQHGSIKSVHWAARCAIRNEWVLCRPREISWAKDKKWIGADRICEAYHLILRWPWLVGYLYEDSGRAIARRAGISETSIAQRINRIRASLGLTEKYRTKYRRMRREALKEVSV